MEEGGRTNARGALRWGVVTRGKHAAVVVSTRLAQRGALKLTTRRNPSSAKGIKAGESKIEGRSQSILYIITQCKHTYAWTK